MELIEVNYGKRRKMSKEFATALAVNRSWIKYRDSLTDEDDNMSSEERFERMEQFIKSALAEVD
jgi:hypothetical protein